MKSFSAIVVGVLLVGCSIAIEHHGNHHHHKKHHHHNKTHAKGAVVAASSQPTSTKAAPAVLAKKSSETSAQTTKGQAGEEQIVEKMKVLEDQLAKKEFKSEGMGHVGKIEVNDPLPADFSERFSKAVAEATGTNSAEVQVLGTQSLGAGLAEIEFQAPLDVIKAVQTQAADPTSSLASGQLRSFLVAKADAGADTAKAAFAQTASSHDDDEEAAEDGHDEATPTKQNGIDIDTAMPYGELEPFGREDTAQELTESSVKESDEMVDQLERAEVAEEKRAVFRALTRLRGAAITSFDGVARSQTGNIDEYNKVHQWRNTHPLHHLADEESDISKWAFPDNADF